MGRTGEETVATPAPVVRRVQQLGICAALFAVALQQSPGRVVGDTKLGIALDPGRFLTSALHLWDPSMDAGVTQNQGYGYLFPMGPFFLVGRALGVAPWLVQRLWWAVLLCVAFLGVVRLARELRIGTPASGLVAGVAFALSPRVLSTFGPISVESLPYCLAPWVLVPLVRGAREGSTRRAAGLSSLAVLGMGAVNAAAVVAALPPAVLWLVTRPRGPRRRSLVGWWVLCVFLATAWWTVPLALLGRYSPPFLDHIEAASVTTSVTSLAQVLRGTSDWVAYVVGGGGPTWPAGFALLTTHVLIASTFVVLVAGLAGLAAPRLPERRWLVLCLLAGVAAVTFGHVGALSVPGADAERDLLDGALAPFRNLHKFDVVLRLPVVLGIAHVVPFLARTSRPAEATARRRLVLLGAVAAVVGAATPLVSPGLAPRGPFTDVPGYWDQTAAWLGGHGPGRALVVPGADNPDYLWGSTNDEPLSVDATSPWTVRSAVPLTPSGTIRYLDAVEARLASGQPSPGLAASLARAGIRYVVVRNDLDYGATGSTRPLLVHEALVKSPGIRRAAAFGPTIGGGVFGRYADVGLELPYRTVEVFQVAGDGTPAELFARDSAVSVVGGAEAVLDLDDRGLTRGRPVLLDASGRPDVLTDSLPRREVFFGRQQQNASPTLTASEPYRLDVPAHDYLPPGATAHLATASYTGARDLEAGSSVSDADAFGGAQPEHLPYAAVDGDPLTSWRSDPTAGTAKAWWRLTFDAPRTVDGLVLDVEGTGSRRTVDVLTDRGHVDVTVPPAGGRVLVGAPAGTTHLLTVRSTKGALGLRQVVLPGLEVQRTVETDRAPGTPVVTLSQAQGNRDECYEVVGSWLCNGSLRRASEDAVALDRTVHLTGSGSYAFEITARPRAGSTLDALVTRGAAVQVRASSSDVDEPRGDAVAAVDGLPGTGWRAAAGDQDPRLVLSWSGTRTITGLQVVLSSGFAASRPRAVRVETATGARTVRLDVQGRATFAALRGNRLTVHLLDPALSVSVDPYTKQTSLLPVGVSELRVTGLPAQLLVDRPVTLPCGSGPDLVVDGTHVRTGLTTTAAALADRSLLPLTLCAGEAAPLHDGSRIRVAETDLLEPVALTARPVGGPVSAPPTDLPVSLGQWTATRRTLQLPDRSAAALLVVHENVNPGWHATLDGARLAATTVDGWQQAWLVPAGKAGRLVLSYGPDRAYRTSLLAGGGLVLLLLLLVAVPGRRSLPALGEGGRSPLLPLACALLLVLTGGVVGLGALVVVLVVRHRAVVPVGLAALAAAGALLALRPWGSPDYAGGSATVQALCVIGLAATCSPVLGDVRRMRSFRRSSGRSSST